MSDAKVALVAGAMGVTGRNLILHLEKCDWKIYGISRRKLDFGTQVHELQLDLGRRSEVEAKLQECKDVTHIFFTAFQATSSNVEDVRVNLGMFVNVVEAAEKAGCKLRHVYFMSGTKWYGVHLAPNKTPFKEEDLRAMTPNFYYDLEDYCIRRVKAGAPWTWSSLRPSPVCGFSHGSYMNLTVTIAVYATLCKELGLPLRFPGDWIAYNLLSEACDADLLAQAMVFCATHQEAGNQSYNVSNGDTFRWSEVWPKIAAYFGMEVATPMKMSLMECMADKEGVWHELVQRHGLIDVPYAQIATWGFADFVFSRQGDWFSNVNKLRRAGFQGQCMDTDEMFLRQFDELRKAKVIP